VRLRLRESPIRPLRIIILLSILALTAGLEDGRLRLRRSSDPLFFALYVIGSFSGVLFNRARSLHDGRTHPRRASIYPGFKLVSGTVSRFRIWPVGINLMERRFGALADNAFFIY